MDHVDESVQHQSIASLASSIRKLEKALTSVQGKNSSTTVVATRLLALQIGYAALQAVWSKQAFSFTSAEADGAKKVLAGLFPSLEAMAPKFAAGSSQATLLARRVRSIQLALQALDSNRFLEPKTQNAQRQRATGKAELLF